MKRNLYAVILLAAVCVIVAVSGHFVSRSVAQTQDQVRQAYSAALAGEYAEARLAFRAASENCGAQSRLLGLFVRRSLLDEINETLGLLEYYLRPDNLADLGAETARVTAQLDQLETSFLAAF